MIIFARSISMLIVVALLHGCSNYSANNKLTTYDGAIGYRFQNLSSGTNSDELFVILAFSGGGTRAAAFSFGVLEALRDNVYQADGQSRSFLEDVDVISSVS